MGEIRVAKTQEEQQIVFGWANITMEDGKFIRDLQDDVIDIETLEEAVYEYVLEYRVGGERHQKSGTGRLIESIVFTPDKIAAMGLREESLPLGWWVGFKIVDDVAWEKIKNGEYLMFSIEGKAFREDISVKPNIKKESLSGIFKKKYY